MFSAVAGMASMFGRKRKEETQTAVLEDIYADLQKIKISFKITIVPASEEREKEFDKEKRHQELLAAFRRAGLAMRRNTHAALGKDDDKDKKGNWLSKLATAYFSYRVLKGFIKRFFKVMKLGRLWILLRGLGFILVRLFWPLAIAAALIWVIPKIIDNWPAIVDTVKNTLNGIWDTLKGWYSWFEGVSQEAWLWVLSPIMEEHDISREEVLGEDAITPDVKPIWDETKGVWMVNDTPLPGIAQDETSKAITYANMISAGIVAQQEALIAQGIVPQQTILGDNVAEISGFDNNFVSMVKEAEGFRGEAYQDEGGNWTVGYGHTGADVMEGTTMSERAATSQLGTDLGAARTRAQVQVDKDFGPGTFGGLGTNEQNLLTDVAFNTGSVSSMPKLTSAVVRGDKTGIATEYERSMTTSSGEKKLLDARNELIRKNLINPIISAPSSSTVDTSGSRAISTPSSSQGGTSGNRAISTPSSSNVSSVSSSVSSTTLPSMTTDIRTPTPGKLNKKVIIINNDPVVVDDSVIQTSTTSRQATNKDYGTSTPFMGLYE